MKYTYTVAILLILGFASLSGATEVVEPSTLNAEEAASVTEETALVVSRLAPSEALAAADSETESAQEIIATTSTVDNGTDTASTSKDEIVSTSQRDEETGVFTVPYYSQIDDITPPEWQGISCGIAALAMLIDFYADPVLPDTLLQRGINSGAYIYDAGWSHQGLINLTPAYGLTGFTNVMHHLSMDAAFAELERELAEGPVIVSVQYTFTPTNPIPHLVVITGVHDDMVYYADPADGTGSITIEKFQSSWKKRYIAVRPQ